MKNVTNSRSDRKLHQVEAEVFAQIRAVFGRCPELSGFSLADRPARIEDDSLSDEGIDLFVSAMGFSAPVSPDEHNEVYSQIHTAISDLLSERPEAFEMLRGRTFVRTLH